MNVIISNKKQEDLSNLGIEVSKKLDGEFTVEEIIENFSNYFFNKMIIDVTAIKNYQDFSTLQKLSINLNIEKIIFLLEGEKVNPSFLSQLVSIGIYNFTTTIDGVMYLYNNPNSYRDVAQYQDPGFMVPKEPEEQKNKINIKKAEVKYEQPQPEYKQENIEQSINEIKKQHIIGIKNITSNAGATTLTYMLKKELSNYKDVVAIEINKKDFIFLRDPDLVSIEAKKFPIEFQKYKDREIILLDLNSYGETHICTDMLYLIEPTTIKLNKMVMLDREVFNKLRGKKVILNKSILSKGEISNLEFETNSKVFYNIPPLDDKKDNSEYLQPLIEKLNI